ncbi:hypothetical protein BN1723_019533, partial [Verticillium longisporum]
TSRCPPLRIRSRARGAYGPASQGRRRNHRDPKARGRRARSSPEAGR